MPDRKANKTHDEPTPEVDEHEDAPDEPGPAHDDYEEEAKARKREQHSGKDRAEEDY